MTFFDLSVVYESTKQKGKQPGVLAPSEKQSLEARIDALVHLGYTVIAINHVVQTKFQQPAPDFELRKREGIIILRRLTIVLDEASEKGFGLTNANTTSLSSYDIISLLPTTQSSFSLACLTHSSPGPITAHIISLDLSSQSRLPFYPKHTLVRTAIRNGAVFEIPYAPALSSNDDHRRRNWWANAREVARVTNGKNLILSGGGQSLSELRAPLDVANLATLLGLAQNHAKDAVSNTTKSLVLRAQTRKTYRAVLSEPKLILPTTLKPPIEISNDPASSIPVVSTTPGVPPNPSSSESTSQLGKRPRDDSGEARPAPVPQTGTGGGKRKKKKGRSAQHADP